MEFAGPVNLKVVPSGCCLGESFKMELRFAMNYATNSGPKRIEVLESKVGEMKVEFSYTRAQIEQMMGMVK